MSEIAPYPECMAPDGAEPCPQYTALLAKVDELELVFKCWSLDEFGESRTFAFKSDLEALQARLDAVRKAIINALQEAHPEDRMVRNILRKALLLCCGGPGG